MQTNEPAVGQVTHAISGEIVATGVTVDAYMEKYAADFCEWVGGTVVKMSPIHVIHDMLSGFLRILFEAYFEQRPIGHVRQAPFVMQSNADLPRREPDLQVILNDNPGT